MKFGIIAKFHAPEIEGFLERLKDFSDQRGIYLVGEKGLNDLLPSIVEEEYERKEVAFHADALVVLGGDGTLLSVADSAARASIPIVGVNLGYLGFLTEVKPEEMEVVLEQFLEGKAAVDERGMLEVYFNDQTDLVLNDVVITKSALARMIRIRVTIDDFDVTIVRADGIIVSTATGSTAYSLSAGGPIVNPMVAALVITPICPHTLTIRPIVIPSSCEVELELLTSGEDVYLTLDGQRGKPLKKGDVVKVKSASQKLLLVRPYYRNYFEMLREKLKWGD